MEQNKDDVINFEMILKHYKLRRRQAIYSEEVENVSSKICSERQYTSKDVLSNISKQLWALQRADSMKNINSKLKVSNWRKGVLEPLHLLSLDCNNPQQSCQNVNKFETQGVSDTQLIQIVENVENLLVPVGMTQEFENSFCEQQTSTKQLIDKTCNNFRKECNEIFNELNTTTVIKESLHQNKCIREEKISLHAELIDNEEIKERKEVLEDNIESNAITNKSLTLDCHLPLICTIDAFENFEKIAFPIVERNTDPEIAKYLIDSEIKRKMLGLCPQTKPVLNAKHDPLNPDLNINKVNLKTPPCNLSYKDVVSARAEKIEMESNNIFEDDVLFSCEEENREETDFRDLPLTCALETSFYNEHNNLDKTMLVGFQTASNRLIEIKTDSFCNALDVLKEVDNNNFTLTQKKIIKNNDVGKTNNMNEKIVLYDTDVNLSDNNSKKDCDQENILEVDTSLKKCNLSKELLPVSSGISGMMHGDMKKNKDFFITSEQNSLDADYAKFRCQPVLQDIEYDKNYDILETKDALCNTTYNVRSEGSTNLDAVFSKYNGNKSNNCIEVFKPVVPMSTQKFVNYLVSEGNNNKTPASDRHKNLTKYHKKIVEGHREDKETPNKNVEEISEEPVCSTQFSKNTFMGFKTANNKQITISEQALAKTKNIFEDCNVLDDVDKNCKVLFNGHYNSVKTKFISSHDISSGEVIFSDNFVQHNEVVIENIETESLDYMTKVENKIGQSNNKFNENFKTPDNDPIVITSAGTVKISESLKEIETLGLNVLDSSLKIGDFVKESFEKTNQKLDNVSGKATEKQKKYLSDDNNEQLVKTVLKEHLINALQNGPDINDIVSRSKNTDFENEKIFKVNNDLNYKGFVTASGKNVFISEEAVAKSKKLLQDFENDEDINKMCCNFGCKELLTDKVTNTKISKITPTSSTNNILDVAIANNNYGFDELNIVTEKNSLCNQGFQGFQTASKKKLKISDQALAKSKQIFKDLEFDENNHYFNEIHKDYPDISTGVKQEFGNESSKFKTANKDEDFDHNFKIAQPFSFQTASKKVIKISEMAIANSKNILQDLDPIIVASQQVKNNEAKAENLDDDFNPDSENYKLNYNINNSKVNKTTSANDENFENNASRKKYEGFDNSNLKRNKIAFEDGFMGFQTGSNKRVKVSDDALAKSKKIFQDLNLNDDYKQSSIAINDFKENISLPGNISESKNILNTKIKSKGDELRFIIANNEIKDTIQNNQNNNLFQGKLTKKCEDKLNLENIIDTQVINDFEETLYTEDFCKEITSNKSKRSGSPILIFPSAKKRKDFKVPYRTDRKQKLESRIIATKENKSKFVFDENYKKNKKMFLSDIKDMEKLDKGVFEADSYILSFKYDNLLDFEFSNERNDLSEDTWRTEDIKHYFLSLVKKEIVPDGWLDNHLKIIISKLIYYETEFKKVMRGVCSVRNVLEQLKYRYDKELYNVERSAFRKILEKDDVSTKAMVLRVVAIYVDGVAVSSVTDADDAELLLTDGWYCIKACLDPMLKKLVCRSKIKVWTKLITHGAELLNCEQGVAPWENTSSVRLKLFGNSTRRARWDARLGYHSATVILTPLSCIELDGGKVSGLRVFVTRVYPTQYVEKFEDGSTVTRSERLEHLHQMKYESETQALLERLYEEVEKEFIDKESQNSECDNDVVRSLGNASQISRLLKQSKDTGEFIENLTNTQCVMLQDYTSRRREKVLQSMQTRLVEKLKAMGLHNGRNVVPVLKIRIADVSRNGEVTKAVMSIWKPNESVLDVIKEGTWIDVFNTAPTAVRYSEIQLSASRRTIFKSSKSKLCEKINSITSNLARTCYSTKELIQNQLKHIHYNEVDIVGLVFLIDPPNDRFESIKGQLFQNVYLTDADKNIVCVNFWGGIRKFGYENILDTGQVVAAMNIQKRAGYSKKSILQFRATEFSYFTKTSKLANVRKLAEDLNKALSFIDIKKLCEECKVLKNESLFKSNSENISPYRIDYSAYNVSKHRASIDSPLTRKPNQVSTLKQDDIQDSSISTLSRKKTINEKITKLKMYGEPPPLNFIHIINKSKNAASAFKSPISTNNKISDNVTSKQLKENRNQIDNVSCPVITNHNNNENRKSAKPMKLNFYKAPSEESDDKDIDPFAEEFDASLPFSLD